MNIQEHNNETLRELASCYSRILELIGEDLTREGLRDTPIRAARAMLYCTRGYTQESKTIVNGAIFGHTPAASSVSGEMVIVDGIEFYSLCEHHILPFFGNMAIGYIPDGRIIGLSKLARLVDMHARRLQVQERLVDEVCQSVAEYTGAKGVIVAARARHLCMQMRGVQKENASTFSISCYGVFETNPELKSQFLSVALR